MSYRKISLSILYGVPTLAIVLILYALIADRIAWPLYATWLVALNTATFWLWGLDKLLSFNDKSQYRTPELVLHSLAVAGGFVGGWLGRFAFHHKTNIQKHPWFPVILGMSTVIHLLLIYFLFFRVNRV